MQRLGNITDEMGKIEDDYFLRMCFLSRDKNNNIRGSCCGHVWELRRWSLEGSWREKYNQIHICQFIKIKVKNTHHTHPQDWRILCLESLNEEMFLLTVLKWVVKITYLILFSRPTQLYEVKIRIIITSLTCDCSYLRPTVDVWL